MLLRQLLFRALVLLLAAQVPHRSSLGEEPRRLSVRDSRPVEWADPIGEAQTMLQAIAWEPTTFEVTLTPVVDQEFTELIRFPSPHPSGVEQNDQVTIAWYRAAGDLVDSTGTCPAVVVIHESGANMEVGRLFARGFQTRGLHAFLIRLPHYGERKAPNYRQPPESMAAGMRQGTSDVRRAYDVVQALPEVDSTRIGLQGTSLGGFVAASTSCLDNCYTSTHIALAGGDLYGIIQNGKLDAAKLRRELAEGGFTGEKLRTYLATVEPTRLAHRLNREQTWMYSALHDNVVPIAHARLLARTAGLAPQHQLEFPGGHYSAIVFLPGIMDLMAQRLKHRTPPPAQD